jgi:hypothetical protein
MPLSNNPLYDNHPEVVSFSPKAMVPRFASLKASQTAQSACHFESDPKSHGCIENNPGGGEVLQRSEKLTGVLENATRRVIHLPLLSDL